MQTQQTMSRRRDFFRLLGRVFLLGTGTAVAARWIRRGQVKLSGQTCVNQGICSPCRSYARCGLPAALSRRAKLESCLNRSPYERV